MSSSQRQASRTPERQAVLDRFLRFVDENTGKITLQAKAKGEEITLTLPAVSIRLFEGHPDNTPKTPARPGKLPFVPNAYQRGILEALDGKAMRAKALGRELGDERRLYRDKGGIKELEEEELVRHHERLGYYRPDAPPAELRDENHSH